MRWLLPAVLAVAVLGMHHVPVEAGHEAHHPVTTHYASTGPAPLPIVEGVWESTNPSCCPEPAAAASAGQHDEAPAEHGNGHDLLHLCLAILIASVASVLVFAALGRFLCARVPAATAGRRPITLARPPPLPTPQRLAFLGVLRL